MAKRRLVPIVRPRSLGEAVSAFIRDCGGRVRAAARQVGLPHSQLIRIRDAVTPYRIEQESLWRLIGFAPILVRAVGLAAPSLFHEGPRPQSWLDRKIGATGREGRGPRVALLPPVEPADERRERREYLVGQLRAKLPKLFEWFDLELAKSASQPTSARRQLAYERVVGPFLDHDESWGIELSWEECSAADITGGGRRERRGRLKRILKYGMLRELMLLDRLPNDLRHDELVYLAATGQRKLTSPELLIEELLALQEKPSITTSSWIMEQGRLFQLNGDDALAWEYASEFLEQAAPTLRSKGVAVTRTASA